MRDAVDLNELRVVGYADVLAVDMLPTVVAPVLAWKADGDRFLLPPFRIDDGVVRNGTAIGAEELAGLVESEEITMFPQGSSYEARAGFELWIDRQFQPHYEPSAIVRSFLGKMANENIALAKAALARGNFDEAQRLAGIAICANDRCIDPLAIRAVICRIEKNPAGERLMAEMAHPALTPEAFSAIVDDLARSVNL